MQPYIQHYVVQESTLPAQVKVVAGTGMVMGFQFTGRVSWKQSNGPVQLSTAGITGILNAYRLFEYTPGIGSLLVIFKPMAAALFLPLPANELQQQSVSMYDFIPAALLRTTEEQIALAKNDRQRVDAVEHFLLQLFRKERTDPLMTEVYHKILSAGGNVRVGLLAKHFYLSPRQLERRFRAMAGASPKQFASIVRFQNALQKIDEQVNLTSLGYEAGYTDQSHFIREFQRFTGSSPGKFLNP